CGEFWVYGCIASKMGFRSGRRIVHTDFVCWFCTVVLCVCPVFSWGLRHGSRQSLEMAGARSLFTIHAVGWPGGVVGVGGNGHGDEYPLQHPRALECAAGLDHWQATGQ